MPFACAAVGIVPLRSTRGLRAALVLALSLTGTRSLAMPPGREWVPPTEFDPAIAYEAPRLWTDAREHAPAGHEAVFPARSRRTSRRMPGWVTRGSPERMPYRPQARSHRPSPGPRRSSHVKASSDGRHQQHPDRDGYFRLVLWPVSPGSIGVPETVAVATGQTTGHAAAEAGGHRWVTHPEQFPQDDPPIFHVRTLYSERPGQWRELPRGTDEELMCALAPLDDHHALRVSGGWNAQRWTVLEDDRVAASGVLSQDPHPILTPLIGCLRPRPSGGAWLLWAVHGVPRVSSFRDGVWSAPQDLTVQHPTTPATFYYFSWGDDEQRRQ